MKFDSHILFFTFGALIGMASLTISGFGGFVVLMGGLVIIGTIRTCMKS